MASSASNMDGGAEFLLYHRIKAAHGRKTFVSPPRKEGDIFMAVHRLFPALRVGVVKAAMGVAIGTVTHSRSWTSSSIAGRLRSW